jgi:hypothetical protein
MEPLVLLQKHAQISMEIRNIVKNQKLDHVCMLVEYVMIILNVKMHQERLIQLVKTFHHYAQQMAQLVFQLQLAKKHH